MTHRPPLESIIDAFIVVMDILSIINVAKTEKSRRRIKKIKKNFFLSKLAMETFFFLHTGKSNMQWSENKRQKMRERI